MKVMLNKSKTEDAIKDKILKILALKFVEMR